MKIRKGILCPLIILLLISLFFCTTAMAAAGTPVITKNPTSEALAIGGKTWFIAHADNATSMSWELVDPNGNVYTLTNAMAMNPGLNLQALEGDTIAVSNVPQSVNGWGVQATFYNQYGSVSTSPAYIYVGDYLNTYGSVIEKYRLLANLGYANYCNTYGYDDVSECARDGDYIGYSLKDVDKNGIPELLISGGSNNYESRQILYELDTLINNTPVKVFQSWPRFRYYLLTDNRIYHESSGGAAYSYFEFFKLNGDHLEFLEGYATANDYDDGETAGRTIYHSSVWNGETEPFMVYGDYNHPDQTWPVEYTDSGNTIGLLFDQFESLCWMPQLTKIA